MGTFSAAMIKSFLLGAIVYFGAFTATTVFHYYDVNSAVECVVESVR